MKHKKLSNFIMSIFLICLLLIPSVIELSTQQMKIYAGMDLSEELINSSLTETNPEFSFENLETKGTVNQIFSLSIFSTVKIEEAILILPKEASIVEDDLPIGISVEKLDQEQHWLIRLNQSREFFSLPLIFEEEGSFAISVGETSTTIDIFSKEVVSFEEEIKEMEQEETTEGETVVETRNTWAGNEIQHFPLTIMYDNTVLRPELIPEEDIWTPLNSNRDEGGWLVSGNPIIRTGLVSRGTEYRIKNYYQVGTQKRVDAHLNIVNQVGRRQFEHRINVGNFWVRSISVTNPIDEQLDILFSLRDSADSTLIDGYQLIGLHGGNGVARGFKISKEDLKGVVISPLAPGVTRGSIIEQEDNYHIAPGSNETIQVLVPNETTISIWSERNATASGYTFYGLPRGMEGQPPPLGRITHNIAIEASPLTGGNPIVDIDSEKMAYGETAKLKSNPNSGYQFIEWEILSGEDSVLEDPTNEETTYTMGTSDTQIRAIYKKQGGSVTAEYLDEGRDKIAEDDILNGFLNEEYETKAKDVEGYTLKEIPDNASGTFREDEQIVTYIYSEDIRGPVDPLNPETEVKPENPPVLPEDQGRLSIDFVSRFNFGNQLISNQDQQYYAQPQHLLNNDGTVNEEERPNYVQISDRRADSERNGWQLSVTQSSQFHTENGKELTGARLQLLNQQLATAQNGTFPNLQQEHVFSFVPETKHILLKAQGNEGTGTWIYRFGDGDTAGKSVALDVPKETNPEATSYSTTLKWELSDVPEN